MTTDPIQHDVDMEAYDAALIESGLFEFVDGDEEETTLTFLSTPDERLDETPA